MKNDEQLTHSICTSKKTAMMCIYTDERTHTDRKSYTIESSYTKSDSINKSALLCEVDVGMEQAKPPYSMGDHLSELIHQYLKLNLDAIRNLSFRNQIKKRTRNLRDK